GSSPVTPAISFRIDPGPSVPAGVAPRTAPHVFSWAPVSAGSGGSPAGSIRGTIRTIRTSMDSDDPVDRREFGRPDQARMCNLHRVQGAVQFRPPEIEKPDQDRKIRGDVVLLPDIGLQQARVVWHTIEDLGRRQTVAFELFHEIRRNRHGAPPQGPKEML